VIHRADLCRALLELGGDPAAIPSFEELHPPPQAPPYRPLSDGEWGFIERHIQDAVRLMRPATAARSFIDNLLISEHAGLSTRYLPDEQEATRQRVLRWSLQGRLEKLCADLREGGQLSEDRLAAFDALAEKAKATRVRILGSRSVRLAARLDKQTES
jgi:hypothetical protein